MAYYSARSVNGTAIVVARFEPGVVVTSLKLEASFEDFGGDVDKRGGEVCDES